MASDTLGIQIGAYTNKSQIGKEIKTTLQQLEHTDSTQFKIRVDGKDFIRQIDTYSKKSGELVKIQKNLVEVTTQYGKILQNVTRDSKGRFASGIVTEVKQAYDHMSTLTTETRKYINQEGERVTQITESNAKGEEYIKIIKQTTNSLGEVITKTQAYDKAMNPLGEEITKIDREVQIATRDFHKFKDAMGNTVTEITETTNNGVQTIHRTVEGVDELGKSFKRTETEIRNANGETKVLNKGLEETSFDEVKLAEQTKKTNNQLKNQSQTVEKNANALKQNSNGINDFISTMGKVIKFQIITKIITGFTTACRESVQVVKEFDSALTEFKKVSDLSGEALDSYTQRLGELGEAVARTRTQMVEASTQFKKSGFSDEDSAQLAQVSALYQNIADSELSAGESASFIISQMKAFSGELDRFETEAGKATHVIDSINEVSNNMAVSSSDIALALSKTSSAMSALGNDYEESIALVTAGTEIMQGQASKVARGLRSFGNQIAKVATSAGELSFEVQGATKSISLMGEDGNLKSTYQVLKEISAEWDNMTTAERQALGITLAGKTQFEVFTSVLTNFEGAEKALNLAIDSNNSAWEENARYMESIEAKTQALKTALENLILGDGGLEKIVKKILDVATAIVKLIDNGGGLITVIGLLSGAMILLNATTIPKLITEFVSLITELQFVTASFIATGQAITTTGTVINMTVPIIGLAVIALTALFAILTTVYNQVTVTVEEIQELGDTFAKEKEEIDGLNKKLNTLKEKLEELNKIESPTIIDQKEIDKTEFEITQLERELALKNKIAEKDKEKLEKSVSKQAYGYGALGGYGLGGALDKSFDKEITKYGELMDSASYFTGIEFKGKQGYQRVEAYIQMHDELGKLITQYQKEKESLEENSLEYKLLEDKIVTCQQAYQVLDDKIPYVVDSLDSLTVGLDKNSALYQIIKGVVNGYNDALLENQEVQEENTEIDDQTQLALDETAKKYGLNSVQIAELNNKVREAIENKSEEEDAFDVATTAMDEYIESIGKGIMTWEKWNSEMDNIQSSYETLSSAIDEYNASQGFSLDTAQALLSLEPEYLAMLQFENGQLTLNKDAIMLKAKAHIEDAKAMVYDQATAELNALAQNKVKDANAKATGEVKSETQALYENSQALAENSRQAYENAYAKAKQSGVTEAEMKAVTDKLKNQLQILDNLADSFGNNFGKAMEKAGGSASKANKQVEKLKETIKELKDEISDYDKVIAYINSKLDGEIKRLEDLRDKEVEAIEKEIKALERELDAEEDSVKAKIDLLESERDALIDSNKEQISALEEKQNLETKYWDEKIQALKDQNNALQEQADLEKLLQDLETARNTKVRVYKKGQGFVWDVDQDKVSKAQKALDAYNQKKEYERKLAELENYKKEAIAKYEEEINYLKEYNNQIKNNYDKQISDLNNYINEFKIRYNKRINDLKENSEKVKEQYDNQIKYFQKYKDEFEKQCKAYETEQNRLLALQKTGIDFENENWKTRLDNLNKFTTEYNKKLAELEQKEKRLKELEASVGASSGGYSGSGNNNNNSTSTTTTKTKTVYVVDGHEYQTYNEANSAYNAKINSLNQQIANAKKNDRGSATAQQVAQLESQKKSVKITTKTVKYASGTASVGSNQFAIVGENPNKEIVIGSKLNGMGLNLSKGTGVVNAKSTSTLAGLFNMLGSDLKSVNGDYNAVNTNNQNANNIHIDNISLPQVRDAEDFVDALSNFQNIMAQKAYAVI